MKRNGLFNLLISIVLIILIIGSFDMFIKRNDENELQILKNTINRSIIEAYAIEGEYPESLAYLCENYGLYINEDAYVIHYRYLGKNLRPELKIFNKGSN